MSYFDRLALRLRPFIFAIAVPALIVFLISYAYALKLMFNALPMWAFALVCVAHIIVWLAASFLHDFQQERRLSQEPGPL